MKQRCNDPNSTSYRFYGGRGIQVCEEWSKDFWAFANFMGPKPDPSYTLDRIDPNGHYEPGNCRWASPALQHANKRKVRPCGRPLRVYELNGIKTLRALAKHHGIKIETVVARLARTNMTLEEALTTPVKPRGRR